MALLYSHITFKMLFCHLSVIYNKCSAYFSCDLNHVYMRAALISEKRNYLLASTAKIHFARSKILKMIKG